MNDQQSSGGLARTIGPFGLGASVINLIIGSSIFVFPATIAATLVLQRRAVGAVGVTVLLAAVTYFASRKAQGAPDHL